MADDQPKKSGRGGARPNAGGARPGAGRPPAEVKNERILITIPPWAAAMLRALGDGHVSRGIVAALEKLRQHE
ncbi:hypothetical protein GALL_299890 [mine drainage metagenome]|uniref:Uncharacterized protein n=1 Tax=mine drainage metagenome TaxID=410659 RepID=A0A1J5R7V4_9ZZZZ